MKIENMHLLVTSICNRDCRYCCNKQYDLNDVPYATAEELKNTENLFITGGEPFLYSNPSMISLKLRSEYPNIRRVVVYTNAYEFVSYLFISGHTNLDGIDGVTVSIKSATDRYMFEEFISKIKRITDLSSNRLYVFPGFEDTLCPDSFTKMQREWQKIFTPAPNSIFRKL